MVLWMIFEYGQLTITERIHKSEESGFSLAVSSVCVCVQPSIGRIIVDIVANQSSSDDWP